MKINTRKKITQKKLFVTGLCGLAILLVTGASLYAIKKDLFSGSSTSSPSSTPTINYDKPTEEQKNAATDQKPGFTNETSPGVNNPSPNKKTKTTANLAFTAINQNATILQVRVDISAVTNTGSCTLTLTRDGRPTITKTASIQALASSSTCKGFDVATSELAPGAWQLQLHFENDNSIGDITKEVTIQ